MVQMALHCFISAYTASELPLLFMLMSFAHLKIHSSFRLRFLAPTKLCKPESFETSAWPWAGLTSKPALVTKLFQAGRAPENFFFTPAHSICEGRFPTPHSITSLSFSSLIQLRSFGVSRTWQAPQVHGNAKTRRLLECVLGDPWRADFCRPTMLRVYRTLPSGRESRWRTTRNLEISHHVLPQN
jgi:hypothetical protein